MRRGSDRPHVRMALLVSSRAVNRASSAKFDALSYAFASATFNQSEARIEATNNNSLDCELLPAFLKDRSNG